MGGRGFVVSLGLWSEGGVGGEVVCVGWWIVGGGGGGVGGRAAETLGERGGRKGDLTEWACV